MLLLALLLLSGPLDEPAARPFPLPHTTVTVQAGGVGEVRTGRSGSNPLPGVCQPILHHVGPSGDRTVVTRSAAFSATAPVGEDRVKMYHLLERTIDGCRVPVIAIEHLPQADRAIGRNLGRFVTPR